MEVRSTTKPVILGLEGKTLTKQEESFFSRVDPFGFILFQRNCETKNQVRKLCTDLRNSVGRSDAPILIDQEGGRVQRLRAPEWTETPPVRKIGELAEFDIDRGRRAAFLHAQVIAAQLRELGITVNCAPCLDLTISGAHEIIGDRSYGASPDLVRVLGFKASEGFVEGGVIPVIKHLPGHGRAAVDSHHSLPVIETGLDVLRKTDFAAFQDHHPRAWGMTGHLMITGLDTDNCSTLSRHSIEAIIRTEIGFEGLLMSDDLSMKALSGTLGERAAAALSAGCDIALHCNGKMGEMQEVADNCSAFSSESLVRAMKAEIIGGTGDIVESERELHRLLAG